MQPPSNLASRNFWNGSTRIKASELFLARGDFADVVRECREAIDFFLKGLLHGIGIGAPRYQDLGALLLQNRDKVPPEVLVDWERMTRIVAIIQENPDAGMFGGGDFMSFGEEATAPAPPPPDAAEARSILDDVLYLESVGKSLMNSLRPPLIRVSP